MEMDFGRWDGLPWSLIPRDEIDVWCEHFADHAPGVGESLRQFMTRVHAWEAPVPQAVVVAHAGWMLARRWCDELLEMASQGVDAVALRPADLDGG